MAASPCCISKKDPLFWIRIDSETGHGSSDLNLLKVLKIRRSARPVYCFWRPWHVRSQSSMGFLGQSWWWFLTGLLAEKQCVQKPDTLPHSISNNMTDKTRQLCISVIKIAWDLLRWTWNQPHSSAPLNVSEKRDLLSSVIFEVHAAWPSFVWCQTYPPTEVILASSWYYYWRVLTRKRQICSKALKLPRKFPVDSVS